MTTLGKRMVGLLEQERSDASPVPAAPARPDELPLPLHRSLRGKGLVATGVLLAYVLLAGAYVASERSLIVGAVEALDRHSQHEKTLLLAEACIDEVRAELEAAGRPSAAPGNHRLPPCSAQLEALEAFDPAHALTQRALQRAWANAAEGRLSPPWSELGAVLHRAADALEIRRRALAGLRERMLQGVQRQYDAVTIQSLLLAAVGLALSGSLAAWFFARLAGDIGRLEAHARRIVHGRRGPPLTVRRDDELGRLMHAVNHIATELDQRERQIELENERRAHHDKMLSVGALAAGIAHEVNNPLAAIIGTAQSLRESGADAAPRDGALREIVAQAERAARAARQLAELAAPEAAEPDWIDLNAMIGRVVQLNGYDRRYRHLALQTVLDPALPALRTAGESLRQVLTQMLAMACEAMLAGAPRSAPLRLSSSIDGANLAVEFALAAPLDFSQPAVQRALLVCSALIEPQGGRLVLRQGAGGVRDLRLVLPADTGTDPG